MKNQSENTKNKVEEFLSDYIKFMQIEDFPDYDINPFDSNEGIHEANLYVTYKEKPILNINKTYTSLLKSNSKPGIYHEFTHIYDDIILLPDMPREEKISLAKMYKEYHAVQVQMKASLKFNSFYDNYNFRLTSITHDWFDNKNVKDDIIYKTKDYIATIKHLVLNKEKGYLFNILLHTTYYISKVDFWNNYCIDDVSELVIPIEDFVNIFGNSFKIYHDYLQQFRNDISYFEVLERIQNSIIEHCAYNQSYNHINEIKYNP